MSAPTADKENPNERRPNPGSKEAVTLGCTCPVIDNAYGVGCGYMTDEGVPQFWITSGCPLHDAGEVE